MLRPVRLALRFSALVAALTLIPLAFSPGERAGSPYLSALSDLSAVSATAAPKCKHTVCGLHVKCNPAPDRNTNCSGGKPGPNSTCENVPC